MKEKANYPPNNKNKIDHFLAFRRKAKIEGNGFCTFPGPCCFYITWACREGGSLEGLQGGVQGVLDSWYPSEYPTAVGDSVFPQNIPLEPERATEAREARCSCEYLKN